MIGVHRQRSAAMGARPRRFAQRCERKAARRAVEESLGRVCKPPSRVILSGVSSWAKVGDDTESKNPLASEGASTRHSTGFLDCVPTRLRPLGTPLRMTAHKGVGVCKHALARISHTLGESGDRVLSRPLLSSEFQVPSFKFKELIRFPQSCGMNEGRRAVRRSTGLEPVRRGGTPIPPVLRGSAAPRTTQRNRSSAGRTDFKSVLRLASASFRQPDCEKRIRTWNSELGTQNFKLWAPPASH